MEKSQVKVKENSIIALYGLGTETERLISEWGNGPTIVGLLDGFKDSGELYGYPIISLKEAIAAGIDAILVVARPGSCKVIAKRIKEDCIKNGIKLFDVRGNDLLSEIDPKYDFSGIKTYKKDDLLKKIKEADVVSFDLFDTLITRKLLSYTDVFNLVADKLDGVDDNAFTKARLAAEKELSKHSSPTLREIYNKVLEELPLGVSADTLANLEWSIDKETLVPREGMKKILSFAKVSGKRIVLTTDSYYSKSQIEEILRKFSLDGFFDKLFVSCEHGKLKTNGLFDEVKEYAGGHILHIGDDEWADETKAIESGIEPFRIYSGKDIFDLLGGFGTEEKIGTLADRIKVGLFLERLFSNPFMFEEGEEKVLIKKSGNVGYLLLAPVVIDFMLWMIDRAKEEGMDNVLLCARDGYLPQKIYNRLKSDKKALYFLASRTAAIRAGVSSKADLDYVDSMVYSGTGKESMLSRFGIDVDKEASFDRETAIFNRSATLKKNYLEYINSLNLGSGKLGVFDFVAKGTTQLFLQKIMPQELKGLYFLQLEPEFMKDKNVDIVSFYEEGEKDTSAIFNYYYVLEAILTSPDPSVNEFDENGKPVYSKETRSKEMLECIKEIQEGILEYLENYLLLVPDSERTVNKPLDEAFLSLLSKLSITDEGFNSLALEDPFFGRNTNIKDII